ncbi:MAG: hypothetical protein GAK35_00411 [Herbaspirillum frisingense]|uniref:DUF3739 domain-containing protein n=1 Tax=Herbaspirillum frisingense TaxID=92645 RepID=A0A7V8JW39_9BURK|nr:MAG: hypothetical protein GAK35_00411 [Herbaspirillum frisingense]
MRLRRGLPSGYTSVNQLVGKTESQLVSLYMAVSFSDFGFQPDFWELGQGNGAVINVPLTATPKSPTFSVVRTGTGDLSLAAGGNFSMQSPYGVYTAGTQRSLGNASLDVAYNQARGLINNGTVLGTEPGTAAPDYERLVSGANSIYQAWYPDGGGNLNVNVGGDLTGDAWTTSRELATASTSVGNWLWRQGTGVTPGVTDVPTSWWINFGTYAYVSAPSGSSYAYWPTVAGFTGMGTLGGGNATIQVGGDAGMVTRRSTSDVNIDNSSRSQGMVLAVGSTGRVLPDGSLVLTGGGDLDVRAGGWNSHPEARLGKAGVGATVQTHELYGGLVNVRGATAIAAGQIGTMQLVYAMVQDAREVRSADPYVSSMSLATGGLMLMAGDSGMNVSSRGDLVLGGTGNAGMVATPNGIAYSSSAASGAAGISWFNLWTDHTILKTFSAGGNLAFDTRASEGNADVKIINWDYTNSGGWFVLPGEVSAVAGVGSIYYGKSAAYLNTAGTSNQWETAGLLVAPQGGRRIEMLAGGSLYGGGYGIAVSGTDTSTMASIWHPGFAGFDATGMSLVSNISIDASYADPHFFPLLAFSRNSVDASAGVLSRASEPSRFYAAKGDIVGLQTGAKLTFNAGIRFNQTDYVGAGPVAIKAGQDIVYSGTRIDDDAPAIFGMASDGSSAYVSGNLLVHANSNDVSVMQAGRDILYANFEVAGPGTLEISAGRNILQKERSSITTIGPVVRGDNRPGAGVVVQAGMKDVTTSYSGLLARYLNPANLAQGGMPLADQPGKVVKTYGAELAAWLAERFGFSGTAQEALAYFNALAPEQQRIFARQVYFAELRAGGREYNDANSPRYGSYLRGRNAIAVMFPATGYQGDLLMYGASGIHTDVGGDIQVLTPGGAQTYGVEGAAPPSTAGLITRGQGDISLYSLESILLGQSRIMTTFGGGITAWSAQGDINAGRGAKTTVVYTPPRRVYDNVGDVTRSPQVPSTGAGIATLAPIAEVPPGDVDLIAPLGTIDAGEAGIRVSGNVNVAALQVVNAANIQVQGKSTGLPVIAAVNIGALTNASAAASSAAMAAQDAVSRERAAARQNLPSVFTVRVLGFGGDGAAAPESRPAPAGAGYDSGSAIQVLGQGNLNAVQRNRLTDTERRNLNR